VTSPPATRVLVAPNSYKETLSAPDAARALASGLRRAWPRARFRLLPLADGGEGTAAVLAAAVRARPRRARVLDPLGRPTSAEWWYDRRRRTAYMDMASASGLALVPARRRDPLRTGSYGTGQLIRAALRAGASRVVVGLGGSATVDAGLGAFQALGGRLLYRKGVRPDRLAGGGTLSKLIGWDPSGLDPRLAKARLTAACDVRNPLFGRRGAAYVFGPQKGATPGGARRLDAGLRRWNRIVRRATGRDVSRSPGAGAAGGLGAGLAALADARLVDGAALVFRTIRLPQAVRWADRVVTGEGRVDSTSGSGKAPGRLAALCRRSGRPLLVVAGSLGAGWERVFRGRGVRVVAASPPGTRVRRSGAARRLSRAAEAAGRRS
jgi:glycerate kinase